MSLISKYLFRGAGFLVAAQVFLTFAITGDNWGGKLAHAAEYALLPIPLLVIGALTTSGNGLRAAGFTILLWAGGGAVAFFSAVYGDPGRDRIPLVQVPPASELSLGFGIANLVAVILLGIAIWLWGLTCEPPAAEYHRIGAR
jgi:hypothetical protein